MLYDRQGDQHYDMISALHKSIRASDDNAALYWCTRMMAGGEDPRYICRRLVRAASEDIGNWQQFSYIQRHSLPFEGRIIKTKPLFYRVGRSACRWNCNFSIGCCSIGWYARVWCHYRTDRCVLGSCTKKSRGIPLCVAEKKLANARHNPTFLFHPFT